MYVLHITTLQWGKSSAAQEAMQTTADKDKKKVSQIHANQGEFLGCHVFTAV